MTDTTLFIGSDEGNLVPVAVTPLGELLSASSELAMDTPATTAPTVTTSSTAILGSNANRRSFLITNPGPTTVYINFGAAATTSHHALEAKAVLNGGAYTNTVNGIVASGTQVLSVTEFET